MNNQAPKQTQDCGEKQIHCAFCDSTDVKFVSLFGQTLLGSQYYCNTCRSFFEVVRFEEEDGSRFKVQG